VVHIEIGGNSYLIGAPITQGFRELIRLQQACFSSLDKAGRRVYSLLKTKLYCKRSIAQYFINNILIQAEGFPSWFP